MTKTKIVETTEKYDENGKLVEKITREETTEDDTVYYPNRPTYVPSITRPFDIGKKWEPFCTTTTNSCDVEECVVMPNKNRQDGK